MTKKLITITGPSCGGKTTLVRKLLQTNHFSEVRSFTSRQPRGGEKDGIDYFFHTPEECKAFVDQGLTAEAIEFKGNYYGILKSEIDEKFNSGKTPIVIVEPKGLKQLRVNYDCFTTYVDSDTTTLYTRFLSRFRETPDANVEYEAKRVASIWLEHQHWPSQVGVIDFPISEYTPATEADIILTLVNASKHYNNTND